jgi:hypothetical protein
VVGVLAPLTIAALVAFLEVSRFGIHLFLREQRNYPNTFSPVMQSLLFFFRWHLMICSIAIIVSGHALL